MNILLAKTVADGHLINCIQIEIGNIIFCKTIILWIIKPVSTVMPGASTFKVEKFRKCIAGDVKNAYDKK